MENRYPEIVTGAFLANKKGQIAFFKSSKWESIMVPPGGHLEYGERLEASVKREVKEEAGVNVKESILIRSGELIEDPSFYRKAHLVFFHYLCHVDTDDLVVDNDELVGYEWQDINYWLSSGRINQTTKETLQKIIEQNLL